MANLNHREMMGIALEQGMKAGMMGEVPIGAVLVRNDTGEPVAASCNQTITLNDPSAHAEILALRGAGRILRNYRLLNTTLYVTIEPCVMCMGAIIHARVSRLVFGALDPKWGGAGSLYDFPTDTRLNHLPEVIGGVRDPECRKLIQDFFHKKRKSAGADRRAMPDSTP